MEIQRGRFLEYLDEAVEPLLNNSKNLVPKSYYDVFGWDIISE